MEYILSKEDIASKNDTELMEIINKHFSFDNFKWQQDKKISINEPFRADYLNRLLYKCPHCLKESKMEGKGTKLICHECENEYELDEYGYLNNLNNETLFNSVPKWYKWERECVREEIMKNKYEVTVKVDIYAIRDMKTIYKLGEGKLTHNTEGFELIGCNNQLKYKQDPFATYTINSDFNWYELGDIISIGDTFARYYCVIKDKICSRRII